MKIIDIQCYLIKFFPDKCIWEIEFTGSPQVFNMLQGIPYIRKDNSDSCYFVLDNNIKNSLVKAVEINDLHEYFSYQCFKTDNGQILFEGYDGLEMGIISNKIHLSEALHAFIVSNMLTVAKDW